MLTDYDNSNTLAERCKDEVESGSEGDERIKNIQQGAKGYFILVRDERLSRH